MKKMTKFRDYLENNKLGTKKDPNEFVKVDANLYFRRNYYTMPRSKLREKYPDGYVSIYNVVCEFGSKHYYNYVIKRMKEELNDGEIGIVFFSGSWDDMSENSWEPRLLYYSVSDESGNIKRRGNLVIQNYKVRIEETDRY